MMRKISSLALAVTVFGLTETAFAQGYSAPFGSSGQFTFAAERLFGFHWVKNSWENGDGTHSSNSGTAVGFGWLFAHRMEFNQPRLGIDVFVVQNLSIGGALGFFSLSGRNGMGNVDGFLVAPRVGFNVPLGQIVTFWPKVGLTYVAVDDRSVFGLGAEANFAIFPRPSWAFLVSPTMDIAPIGSHDVGNGRDADYRAYSFGLSFGIMGTI
jgi:hypothetical protein